MNIMRKSNKKSVLDVLDHDNLLCASGKCRTIRPMAEEKKCKQCGTDFTVTDEDLAFYEKISPTFNGKKFDIPAPTLCQQCRHRRRLGSRNAINLYKRKCDLCNEDIVSVYSPDKKDITVYCSKCWWSDKWDPKEFARDYDPEESFIDQVIALKQKVPQPALMNVNSENSEFSNFSNDNNNCYLIFMSGRNENVYYSYWAEDSKTCADISHSSSCELCFDGVNLGRCYNTHFAVNCGDCRDSYFIENCTNCKDCIMCSSLNQKQYCVRNKQLTKEEYERIKQDFVEGLETKLEEYRKEFRQVILSKPKRFSQILRSENCSGENIFDSKDCHDCFFALKSEGCRYCFDIVSAKDSLDITGFGIPIERVYEAQNIGLGSARSAFISFAYQLSDSYYCEHCYYADNLFGCVGMKNHARNLILNKQYSEQDYQQKVCEIITNMQRDGEWGEYFSPRFSTFGYNETIATEYFPLDKKSAKELGYHWLEQNYDIPLEGSPYEPKPISVYRDNEVERQNLLNGILKCQTSNRPYKITGRELLFYIKNNLPIPREHFVVRMRNRMKYINPTLLHHRQCMCEESGHDHDGKRCPNEFETTYAPERPEKVYCEKCYQQSVR